jgi:hypothetical protein
MPANQSTGLAPNHIASTTEKDHEQTNTRQEHGADEIQHNRGEKARHLSACRCVTTRSASRPPNLRHQTVRVQYRTSRWQARGEVELTGSIQDGSPIKAGNVIGDSRIMCDPISGHDGQLVQYPAGPVNGHDLSRPDCCLHQ